MDHFHAMPEINNVMHEMLIIIIESVVPLGT
jgi:hypothetical protein